MTEPTNTNYADAISWLGGADNSLVDSAAGALKWGSILGREVIWDPVEVGLNTDVWIVSL
jgi:hypothetical protein